MVRNLTPHSCRSLLLVLGLSLLVASAPAAHHASPTPDRFAHIVLFVPDDAEIPKGYQERLTAIALRTEAFFADGISQWGWPVARQKVFARTGDGEIEVTLARGALPEDATGRKGFPLVGPLAMAGATAALGDRADENTVWWTFYHTPKRVIKGFRGGGDRDGGRAINIYPTAPAEVAIDVELGAPEMWPLNLKGALHEFGHALGLPHIGAKPATELGNTLMGPINRAYASRLPKGTSEPRVYLCEGSAALLAKHPLFVSEGPTPPAGKQPARVNDLAIKDGPDGSIEITGKVSGPVAAHSVMILDSDRRFGDYWSRSYVAKIDENGKFHAQLDEPFESDQGFITLYVCLEDGRNKAVGPEGAMRFSYEGDAGGRKFSPTLRE
ncbi:MAG: hypothetical protein SynsKO_43530 [Synoicihabitans sp.]